MDFRDFVRSPSFESRPEITRLYGSKCFREAVIRERLTKSVYESYLKTIELGRQLDVSIAPDVANAMMSWAIAQGATHYAHWFLPMTNTTACKHDAFFNPTAIGEARFEFPPSTLVRGEPDASSFPSGGLRATFEARGYTTWDPTSPAFVRDGTLYIPSVFLSYNGEALDRKAPLLKSLEALNKAVMRFLRFFPKVQAKRVTACAGAEQEYFLVDRELFKKRMDLRMCGRTLIGALPSKGQQLDDHYMGHIRIAVADYMSELDRQLWELGVPAKTKHNEVAPAQHELAPVFETVNIASDHNQMTMEVMRTVAKRKNLACLLHEKPFAGLNGSGKHNNYSVVTDSGYNLFKPRAMDEDDGLFLLSLCAFIRGVDMYADLLRMSAASPSNDHRLGGFEAPPAILSIFLGEALTEQLSQASQGITHRENSREALAVIPAIPDTVVDDSDRNRTSPMAFTGNKFEFRMLGSSQSIAVVNTILDAIVADSFNAFAERLEKAENVELEKKKIIAHVMSTHGRIIFNGNNYSKEWEKEASRRGLPVAGNTVDALEAFISTKNISLFERLGILSKEECRSRYEVQMEGYIKTVGIEANTLLQMVKRQVLPAVNKEVGKLAAAYNSLQKAMIVNEEMHENLKTLSGLYSNLARTLKELEVALTTPEKTGSIKDTAIYHRDVILPLMTTIRTYCDACESMMAEQDWPIPSYTSLLYSL